MTNNTPLERVWRMTKESVVQINVTWVHMVVGAISVVTSLLLGVWWLAGVRASELDAEHHKTAPSETKLYLAENYVSRKEFDKSLDDIKEGQVRIEVMLEQYMKDKH